VYEESQLTMHRTKGGGWGGARAIGSIAVLVFFSVHTTSQSLLKLSARFCPSVTLSAPPPQKIARTMLSNISIFAETFEI